MNKEWDGEGMSEMPSPAGTVNGIPLYIPPVVPKPTGYVPVEKSLYVMMAEVKANNTAKGWRDNPRTFGEMIALLHSEVTEALQAYRIHQLRSYTSPDGKPNDVASELADVFIRLIDMCDLLAIDLQREYERKMEYNRTRDHRHGGKAL